ncbi:MAG: hypothetical protein LQ345_002571 [Seirophora villosa]|nr:MAG: hypothetical protein LQ345_002571 [Seirophora villosa]
MDHLPHHTDILIIGAGIQGLVVAKTYLQLSPHIQLLILDSQHSIGGVWAKENCYTGLRTNNQLGTFEFTDYDIEDACPGKVRKGEHIPAEVAHDYLSKYAETFDLVKRVRLGYKVLTAEHLLDKKNGGWRLTVIRKQAEAPNPKADLGNNSIPSSTPPAILTASRILVCTGLTSSPLPISLTGSSSFLPPLLTFHDFRRQASALLSTPNIKHVAIYGSSKSAYDAVYAFASRSIKVTWIIRASGHGPVYMAPSHIYLGPLRCWLELLVTTRPLSWLSPCVWGDKDGFGFIRRLLQETRIGRFVVRNFWKKLGGDVVVQTGLQEKGLGVEKLIPKESALWYGTGVSILNYESDIHQFIRNGTVNVLRTDIERLEGRRILLKLDGAVEDAPGSIPEVDALICSTGWRWDSGLTFLPNADHANLGIPSASYTPTQAATWDALDAQADAEILARFPILATGPSITKDDVVIPKPVDASIANEKLQAEPRKQKKEELTPWRLFRGIAPPSNPHRDIVFLGMMSSFQTLLRSEVTALWAYAYLNNAIAPPEGLSNRPAPRPPALDDSKQATASQTTDWLYETALFSRFCRWRYPMGYGARFPDFVFDAMPHFDMLLRDLGLRSWRKGWGWVGEVFGGAYLRGDYRGLVEEWRERTKFGKMD